MGDASPEKMEIPEQMEIPMELEDLFSMFSVCKALYLPPPISKYAPQTPDGRQSSTGTITKQNPIKSVYGLYVVNSSDKGNLHLQTFNVDGCTNVSTSSTVEGLKRELTEFMSGWKLKEVKVSRSSYAVIEKCVNDLAYQFVLNKKTMDALRESKWVRAINVSELKDFKLGEGMNATKLNIYNGTQLYTPEVRGDLVRLNNANVLSDVTSDGARLWTSLELMKSCPADRRKQLFKSYSAVNSHTTDKHTILYNFCVHGDIVQVDDSINDETPGRGLKPEQIKAAEDFALEDTKCSLLYWSPGVGKTLGAWAAIIKAASVKKADNSSKTTGVTFLSSGHNLPKFKFVKELLDNYQMLGLKKVTSVKKDLKTTSAKAKAAAKAAAEAAKAEEKEEKERPSPGYTVGWYWDISLEKNNGETLKVTVVASTYYAFSRGISTYMFEKTEGNPSPHTFLEEDAVLFVSPKLCDLVLNVCDEAHILRTTSVEDMKAGKRVPVTVDENTTSEERLIITQIKNQGITEPYPFHRWAWPPDSVEYSKIPWEGLRVADNAYVETESNQREQKTLLLTATPFGNEPPHLYHLLSCGLYAANAEDVPGLFDVSKSPGKNKKVVDEFFEKVKQLVDKPTVKISSATIDPRTAPRQDFGCCHFFLGEGGNIIAPGGSTNRNGGVPWLKDKLLESTILNIRTSREKTIGDNLPREMYLRKEVKTTRSLTVGLSPAAETELRNTILGSKESETHVVTYSSDSGEDKTVIVNGPLSMNTVNTHLNLARESIELFRVKSINIENQTLINRVHNLFATSEDVGVVYTHHEGVVSQVELSVEPKLRQEQLMKLNEVYKSPGSTRDVSRSNADVETLDSKHLMSDEWIEVYKDGKNPIQKRSHLREHLRAYSPRYELLFRMLETQETRRITPIVLFFSLVSGHSLEYLEGFEWYLNMRNRHWNNDYYGGEDGEDALKAHNYWVLKFTDGDSTKDFKLREGMNAKALRAREDDNILGLNIAECLEFYSARADRKNPQFDEPKLKKSIVKAVREKLWDKLANMGMSEDEKKAAKTHFTDHPELNHVVCTVTGKDGENAREWASYLLNERCGAYNHPANRFGEIIRVIAGADKIGESNDFRNTRHMFFTSPETDVVKLLQKFGRIARSSDPKHYPHYRYGFHKDHLEYFGDDGNMKYGVPIVHYVTLARPEEVGEAFNNIKKKMLFYNEYGRLLSRDKSDEGLVVHESRVKPEWDAAIKVLQGVDSSSTRIRKFKFDDEYEDIGVLSNLHGGVEWDYAISFFTKGGDDASLQPHTASFVDLFDTSARAKLTDMKAQAAKWTMDNLKKVMVSMFKAKVDTPTWENLFEEVPDSVPTGVIPRMILNILVKRAAVGENSYPILAALGINRVNGVTKLDSVIKTWLEHCQSRVERAKNELEKHMRNKFNEKKYRDVLLATGEDVLFEIQPAPAGIKTPYGYDTEFAMDMLNILRDEGRGGGSAMFVGKPEIRNVLLGKGAAPLPEEDDDEVELVSDLTPEETEQQDLERAKARGDFFDFTVVYQDRKDQGDNDKLFPVEQVKGEKNHLARLVKFRATSDAEWQHAIIDQYYSKEPRHVLKLGEFKSWHDSYAKDHAVYTERMNIREMWHKGNLVFTDNDFPGGRE